MGTTRTSTATASSRSLWGFGGPQRRAPDLSGHCWTPAAHCRTSARRQRECQIECHEQCQNTCQKVCRNGCQIECQNNSKYMPERMSISEVTKQRKEMEKKSRLSADQVVQLCKVMAPWIRWGMEKVAERSRF